MFKKFLENRPKKEAWTFFRGIFLLTRAEGDFDGYPAGF